jgi:hypothetical protein
MSDSNMVSLMLSNERQQPFNRHSPDDSRSGENIRAFPAFLQDRREAQTATGTSGTLSGG